MSRHTRGSRGKAPQEFTPGTDTDASMHHNPSIAWLNAAVSRLRSTQARPAIPADLKGAGVVFRTLLATKIAANRWHVLEGLDDPAGAGKIAFVHDPHLRVRVHDRQLPYPALCILVEHMRFDPGLIQEVSDQVCIGEARSRIELFQVVCGGRVELHLTATSGAGAGVTREE
jgi:hypothetical protein